MVSLRNRVVAVKTQPEEEEGAGSADEGNYIEPDFQELPSDHDDSDVEADKPKKKKARTSKPRTSDGSGTPKTNPIFRS